MKFFVSMFFCFSFVLAANDSVSSNDMHTKLDDMIVERGFASSSLIGDIYGSPIASSFAPSNTASSAGVSSAIVLLDAAIGLASGNGAIFKDGPFGTNITGTNTTNFLSSAGTLTINGSLIVTGILTIQDGVTLNVRGNIYLYGSLNIIESVGGVRINADNFICDGVRNGTSVINSVEVHTAIINVNTLIFKNYYTTDDQAIIIDSLLPAGTFPYIFSPAVKTTINANQIIFDNNQGNLFAVFIYVADIFVVNDIAFTNNISTSDSGGSFSFPSGYPDGYAIRHASIPPSNPLYQGTPALIKANMIYFSNNSGSHGGFSGRNFSQFYVDIFKLHTDCILNQQLFNGTGTSFFNRDASNTSPRIIWKTNLGSCVNISDPS